jgi:hypothetical protein
MPRGVVCDHETLFPHHDMRIDKVADRAGLWLEESLNCVMCYSTFAGLERER